MSVLLLVYLKRILPKIHKNHSFRLKYSVYFPTVMNHKKNEPIIHQIKIEIWIIP